MEPGQNTAFRAALAVEQHAQEAMYEVRAEPERDVQVARVLNHMLHETALGQIRDITGDRRTLTSDGSLRTALLKTSRYTIVAPLQIGAILAGATKPDLDKLEAYGDPAGLAFQMHDDILGVFGELDETGKPPTDIHEGKLTWMMLTALQRTVGKEHRTLKRSLGNKNLGKKQFETCRAIVRECGALDETKKLVSTLAHDALTALEITPAAWKDEPLQLLRAMPRSFMR